MQSTRSGRSRTRCARSRWVAFVLKLHRAAEGPEFFGEGDGEEVLEDPPHLQHQPVHADGRAVVEFVGRAAQHEARDAEGGVVANVQPGRCPGGQGTPGDEPSHAVQPQRQVAQQPAGARRDGRQAQQSVRRGEEQPVLGDVDGVVVVTHLDRHRETVAPLDLRLDADAAPHDRQRLLRLAVTEEDALLESPFGGAREGVGQRGQQFGALTGVDFLAPPASRLLRVAEEVEQAVDRRLRPDADLHRIVRGPDPGGADQAVVPEPPEAGAGTGRDAHQVHRGQGRGLLRREFVLRPWSALGEVDDGHVSRRRSASRPYCAWTSVPSP